MNTYDLYAAILAVGIILCAMPIYSIIRNKFQDLDTSFDPITEEPDNFEQEILDFETDGVEYWINNSKGFWGESQENKEKDE